jgi:opacity protein-like surface antigen
MDTMTFKPASLLPAIVAILLAAGGARADDPIARGRWSLEGGLGPARAGAPVVLLSGGYALVETGSTRLDLLGRVGFAESETIHVQGYLQEIGQGKVQAVSGGLELALALRFGRFEPWVGGGLAVSGVDGTIDYRCDGTDIPACSAYGMGGGTLDVTGTSATAATVAGGLRVALSNQFLLGAEVRYQGERRSRIDEFATSAHLGGASGLVTFIWRPITAEAAAAEAATHTTFVAPAAAPKPQAPAIATSPSPPPGPAEPPLLVPPPAAPCVPLFALHDARRYRCFPDPVRGGTFCEGAVGGVHARKPRRAGGDRLPDRGRRVGDHGPRHGPGALRAGRARGVSPQAAPFRGGRGSQSSTGRRVRVLGDPTMP